MNLGHAIYENVQLSVDYIFIEIRVGEVNKTHGSTIARFGSLHFEFIKNIIVVSE
jgi:hypothetical protein